LAGCSVAQPAATSVIYLQMRRRPIASGISPVLKLL
jgi:hypothetical protein